MAIFASLQLENIIQIDDKTRLDGSTSYTSKDEADITLVEIEPEGTNGFIDVTGTSYKDWFLDWSYSGSSRTVTVSIRITTDGVPVTFTRDIEVLTPADDYLFSSDQDLTAKESDVLKYIPKGRNSWLNVHRNAQELIIADFDERGVCDTEGKKLTKAAVVDITEVQQWSIYLALWLIHADLSNAVDDVFARKTNFFLEQVTKHKNRAFIRLDKNGDGELDNGEGTPIQHAYLIRR